MQARASSGAAASTSNTPSGLVPSPRRGAKHVGWTQSHGGQARRALFSCPSLLRSTCTPGRRAVGAGAVMAGVSVVQALEHIPSALPAEVIRRLAVLALASSSTAVTHSAMQYASLWFTTLCALSVALGAMTYNLFAHLSAFFDLTKSSQSQAAERLVLYGVDVSNSRFFSNARVLEAVEFAANAHKGQFRKTGEPYVSHCIETALIVEHNLPPRMAEARYTNTIITALLHDVIDDTPVDLSAIQQAFGNEVADMVSKVSKLSLMNQLLRRGKRKGWAEYAPDHIQTLRKVIVDMVFEEPLVILVKLADRLHNMRTVYVLAPDKQKSVAEETREVWCSLAESLGWDGMKSEMEDLCFAVLECDKYTTLRFELDAFWKLSSAPVIKQLVATQIAEAAALTALNSRARSTLQPSDKLALPLPSTSLVSASASPMQSSLSAPGESRAQPSSTAAAGGGVLLAKSPGSNAALQAAASGPNHAALLPSGSSASMSSSAAKFSSASAMASSGSHSTVATVSRPSAATAVLQDLGLPAQTLNSIDMLSMDYIEVVDPLVASEAFTNAMNAAAGVDSTSTSHPAHGDSRETHPHASSARLGPQAGARKSHSQQTIEPGPAGSYNSHTSANNTVPADQAIGRGSGSTSTSSSTSGLLNLGSVMPVAASAPTLRWRSHSPGSTSSRAGSSSKALGGSSRHASTAEPQRQQQGLLGSGMPAALQAVLPSPAGQAAGALAVAGVPAGPSFQLSPQQQQLKDVLSTVVPFDAVCFKNLKGLANSTRRGLEVLDEAAAFLYSEMMVRSQSGGLNVNIQGRLKSLNSVYRKMLRKGVPVSKVFDARALRVIVDDEGGERMQDAVDACYRLVGAVHSIWKPIRHEFDDYIANPKPSGYSALHTAVRGPGGIPMEVQIKTSSMHELAEYGCAAHWVYKEYLPPPASTAITGAAGRGGRAGAGASASPAALPKGYTGQPVLKVSKDKLRYGVVVAREDDDRRLLAAIKLGTPFPLFPTRVPDYAFYRSMLAYVREKAWSGPGRGDLTLRLEEYVKCDDGRYHRRDHMGYIIPAETITLLEGFEEDAMPHIQQDGSFALTPTTAAAATTVDVSATGSGSEGSASVSASGGDAEASVGSSSLSDEEATITLSDPYQDRLRRQMQHTFLRTQQLRSMLEWGKDTIGKYAASSEASEVSVLIWPGGKIEHFARGTTAGDVIAEKGIIQTGEGYDGYRVHLLVNINNKLVPESTVLQDGDLVILSREKVNI